MPRRRRNRSRSSISRPMARSIVSSCSTTAAYHRPSARPSSSPVKRLPSIGTRPEKRIRTRSLESDASDRSRRGPKRTPRRIWTSSSSSSTMPRRGCWRSPRWRRPLKRQRSRRKNQSSQPWRPLRRRLRRRYRRRKHLSPRPRPRFRRLRHQCLLRPRSFPRRRRSRPRRLIPTIPVPPRRRQFRQPRRLCHRSKQSLPRHRRRRRHRSRKRKKRRLRWRAPPRRQPTRFQRRWFWRRWSRHRRRFSDIPLDAPPPIPAELPQEIEVAGDPLLVRSRGRRRDPVARPDRRRANARNNAQHLCLT